MADPNCDECSGTGEILTEGVMLGRSYYCPISRKVITPMVGDGKWIKTVCYCLSDEP
jgi:hypothetical protein